MFYDEAADETSSTILVVESDRGLREALCMILQMDRYVVLEASSTTDAMPLIDQFQLSLVIVDAGAVGLVRFLSSRMPEMPVIMMDEAAYWTQEYWPERQVNYLPKPFRRDTLLNIVALRLSALKQDITISAP